MNAMLSILEAAGVSARRDHPAGGLPKITEAVVAVGLAGLDLGEGKAEFSLRVLSPGRLGGWHCQQTGAAVAQAAEERELSAVLGEMTYLSGCDCFCAELRVRMDVYRDSLGWHPGSGWKCVWNGVSVEGVTEFSAEEQRNRRLVGGHCQSEPVAVTPGQGGWRLKLVQKFPGGRAPQTPPEEPFELRVQHNGTAQVFSGCCWDRTRLVHTQAGILAERQGFALKQEVC